MALELDGKMYMVQSEQSGAGQNGKTWRKQAFLIETEEQYPKKVLFNVWGEMVDTLKTLKVGDKLRVSFRAESRSFNEKWYTDLTAWKIVKVVEQTLGGVGYNNNQTQNSTVTPENIIYDNTENYESNTALLTDEKEDDLPF